MAIGRWQLEPYEPSSGSWTEWEERLSFFLESNDITDETKKKATFLTVCGKQTYSLIRSLISPQKPTDVDFATLRKKVREHHDPTPSVHVSRFKFGSCRRRVGQTIADYVAALRKASEHCGFESTLEDRLLEQLVICVDDERMQRRLLAEKSVDFSTAVRICLAQEASAKDAHLMSAKDAHLLPSTGERAEAFQAVKGEPRLRSSDRRCWRCLGANHSADVCRFRNSKCYNCSGTGHVAKACPKPRRHTEGRGRLPRRGSSRQRATNAISTSEQDDWDSWSEDDSGAVQRVSNASPETADVNQVSSTPPFRCNVHFQRTQVDMEIDTGSCNTLIGEDTYRSLQVRPKQERDQTDSCKGASHPVRARAAEYSSVEGVHRSSHLLLQIHSRSQSEDGAAACLAAEGRPMALGCKRVCQFPVGSRGPVV